MLRDPSIKAPPQILHNNQILQHGFQNLGVLTYHQHIILILPFDCTTPVIDALRTGGVVIRSVNPVRQSLEDLFLESVADLAKPQPEQAA